MPHKKNLQETGGVLPHTCRQPGSATRLAVLAALLLTLWATTFSEIATSAETNPPAHASDGCTPGISHITAAPAADAGQRPHQGWVSVTLPDYWQTRWPDTNEVWYRVHWQHCQPTEPPALTIGQISMAAEIYLNDSLLSRSASLHEPYSRSWNMPQYWVLPAAALLPGDNTLWLRVTGNPYDRLGLGSVYIGDISSAESIYQTRYRVQRQTFILNAALSLALGGLFLILWAVRRSETAFAWFGLASMLWAVFAFTMLATTPWPFSNSIDWNRAIAVLLTLYCCTFCFFTWRFGEQEYPRFSRILVAVTGILAVGVWWLPDSWMPLTLVLVLPAYALLFLGNCLQFQFHAWRQREKHITLLAVCLLLFLIVCLHDVVTVIFPPADPLLWAPVSSPIAMLFMFIIVAERYAQSFRRIEQFNVELQSAVETTRADLTETLQHKHQLETSNIRLTERLALSHDLHDSLGSTLVRSIALVEQAQEPLKSTRVLSMLKELRDDLRQLIDSNSPTQCAENLSPAEWIAPLRQRFVRLFDEQGIASRWTMPPEWPCQIASSQRMELTRFIEEALSNAIKHSAADSIDVVMSSETAECCCEPTDSERSCAMQLQITDNGRGFDVTAAKLTGGIGMHSMEARIAKIGARLGIDSRPGQTCLSVWFDPHCTCPTDSLASENESG